jgi:hypothetical protein
MSVRDEYSFSVSTRWSATTAIVIPDAFTRYDSATRSPSCQYSWVQDALFDLLRLARVEALRRPGAEPP